MPTSPILRLRALAAAAALVLGALAAHPAAAATFGPGDLVKLQDDGDLTTESDSAVYYVGSDDKRYAFPNSQTYFTWYANFDAVKIVSADDLASLPLGGNVTYRPGTRLVKIVSDPHVYAVEPGGRLRWVETEEVAKGLFGDQWNQRIDDVPDAFFTNYAIDQPLVAVTYPSGSIVKRASDGALFRIENGTKRKIGSADVASALRLQDQFMLPASGDLANYPDGTDIVNAEPALTDTAQKNVVALPSVPTFTARVPATNFIPVGGEATLLELRFASLSAMTVKRMTVRIDATTNNPVDVSLDDDKGGLVYQNNARANFTDLHVVDGHGAEPFGTVQQLAVDVAKDQSQTLVFQGAYAVPAGTEETLYVRAKTNALLPDGEGYKATLVVAGTEVVDGSTGADVAFSPTSDIEGTTLATLSSTLDVTAPSTPDLHTYVRGATDADVGSFQFKATTVAPNVVRAVTFQGYIDEESNGTFLPGSDADNGPATEVRAVVPQVSLFDSNGAKLGGPVSVSPDGKAAFTGLSYTIGPGQTATLVLRGDVPKTVDLEAQPDIVSFDVADASTDVQATDDKGAAVAARGKAPIGGTTPTSYVTVRSEGSVAWSWSGTIAPAIVGREVLLGTLTADAKYDAYDIKAVSFRRTQATQSLGQLRLEYPSGASTASSTADLVGDTVTFTGLGVVLNKDAQTVVKLYGRLKPKDNGAIVGEEIKMQFGSADTLNFVSHADGTSFDQSKIAATGDFTATTNTASDVTVRLSGLTFAAASDMPSGTVASDNAMPVLRFTATAEPEGPVRIKKLTFKLSPADVGRAGKNNDALEKWAGINGDFADDDGVANLRMNLSGSSPIVGEDSSCHITYSILENGVKNPAPSTVESASGDVATLEYDFADGAEPVVNAGTSQKFTLELDTAEFDSSQDWGLGVELSGGDALQWTDIPTGGYVPHTGADATGLPISSSLTVQK